MHELSIAQSIIDIAREYLEKPEVNQIHEVEIEIGALSGVVKEALEFAMETSTKGTRLEKAKIIYHHIKGIATCLSCNKQFDTDELLATCPYCGSINHKIFDGKQLRIKSIKIT